MAIVRVSPPLPPSSWGLAQDPSDPIARTDPTDPIDSSDPAEPIDNAEPMDPIERADPIEPNDSAEPIEPTDNAEPIDATERADPIESHDNVEPWMSTWPLRRPARRATASVWSSGTGQAMEPPYAPTGPDGSKDEGPSLCDSSPK